MHDKLIAWQCGRDDLMTQAPRAGYMLDNGWREARHRLTSLEDALDAGTTRRLGALGIGPGCRCAEVGAGGGSITRWLCSQVGPAGRVVAVDLDTRFIDGLDEPNLEVRQADVTSSHLEHGAFDVVHTRAVLMHIPTRAQVLEKLVAAVRPGGWLLLEEIDFYPVLATATGNYLEVYQALLAAWTAGGGATDWARGLPQILDGCALDAVDSETTVEAFRGGTPMAGLMQGTFEQLRGPMLACGLREEVLDEVISALGTPDWWFPGFAVVAAWGQHRA
jgi:SAM-dependent methyltransferase